MTETFSGSNPRSLSKQLLGCLRNFSEEMDLMESKECRMVRCRTLEVGGGLIRAGQFSLKTNREMGLDVFFGTAFKDLIINFLLLQAEPCALTILMQSWKHWFEFNLISIAIAYMYHS